MDDLRTTNGGEPRCIDVGASDANGDLPVIHIPSGGTVATKYRRADAEMLAAELNALTLPFHEETCCDSCQHGWELIDDDGEHQAYAPCQTCGGEIALEHFTNEAVRLRIVGAVI